MQEERKEANGKKVMVPGDLGPRQSTTIRLSAKIDPKLLEDNVHPGEGPAVGGLNVEVKYTMFASSDIDQPANSLMLTF